MGHTEFLLLQHALREDEFLRVLLVRLAVRTSLNLNFLISINTLMSTTLLLVPYMCSKMMITLTMKAFFLLSLFAFLGTRARNLPGVDDKLKISDTNYGKTSTSPLPAPFHDIQIITMTNYGKEAKPTPPPPYAAPSKGHLTNSSRLAGRSCNIIISTIVEHKPSLHPPPPPETGGGEHYISPKPYTASA